MFDKHQQQLVYLIANSVFIWVDLLIYMYTKLAEGDTNLKVIQLSYFSVALSLAVAFSYIFTRLNYLTYAMLELQGKKLVKYQRMFNAIQKSIIVVKNDQITYFNSKAAGLFKILRGDANQLPECMHELSDESLFKDKMFYIYENLGSERCGGSK